MLASKRFTAAKKLPPVRLDLMNQESTELAWHVLIRGSLN